MELTFEYAWIGLRFTYLEPLEASPVLLWATLLASKGLRMPHRSYIWSNWKVIPRTGSNFRRLPLATSVDHHNRFCHWPSVAKDRLLEVGEIYSMPDEIRTVFTRQWKIRHEAENLCASNETLWALWACGPRLLLISHDPVLKNLGWILPAQLPPLQHHTFILRSDFWSSQPDCDEICVVARDLACPIKGAEDNSCLPWSKLSPVLCWHHSNWFWFLVCYPGTTTTHNATNLTIQPFCWRTRSSLSVANNFILLFSIASGCEPFKCKNSTPTRQSRSFS